MLLRPILLTTLVSIMMTSCIGLKSKPDTTKTYALGLSDPVQDNSVKTAKRGYLARPQFPVYMEGNTLKMLSKDGEILALPNARWAEPIDTGIARTVSHFIALSNNDLKSDFYPWVRDENPAFTIKLSFHHLIATQDGRILISANWICNYADGEVKQGLFADDTIEWSPKDAQSMVNGINKALNLLAKDIASTLGTPSLSSASKSAL